MKAPEPAVAGLIGVAMLAPATTATADSPWGAQSAIIAVSGTGSGLVVIAPNSSGQGDFRAHVIVNVHNTAPDTLFSVTRAVDFTPDGVCTGTQFDQVATLQTSSAGAGAVNFERSGAPSGTVFDVVLRLSSQDGTDLQSGCLTITVK